MKDRPSFRALAAAEQPLISPTAHDALTARMIELCGFKAIAIGGSTMLAARYGMPDVGLAALSEMVQGARDILNATDLALIMDGDDGYGDVKAVVHTTITYEQLGVGAVVFEDQMRACKQPGNRAAKGVVPAEELCRKLKAAVDVRDNPEMLVIARSDSYRAEGIDGSLRRSEQYLKAGADGVFIPGLASISDVERVARSFAGTYQMIDMLEGRDPWLHPKELSGLGFQHIVYPAYLMLRQVDTLKRSLDDLRAFAQDAARGLPKPDLAAASDTFKQAVQEQRWFDYAEKYSG